MLKTINQLLDKFDTLKLDQMTPELGKIRQNLIDMKSQSPKGGLISIENSKEIVGLINDARALNRQPKAEKAVMA